MNFDYISLANRGLRGLKPYQAGKPIEELERELGVKNSIKLASNENPFGVADSVKNALQTQLSKMTLYPDANGFALKNTLADKFGIKTEHITLGNGSNDLIELIARAFVHDQQEVIYSQYAFIVYSLVCQALNVKSVVIPANEWGHDLAAMLAAITDQTKLIFIANPNNPTGTFIEKDQLKAFIQRVPQHVLIILDEAYTEFTPLMRQSPSFSWVDEHPNLIVCRTFSKAYGLAGLRIGYAISSSPIADILNRVRQPFNCNALALIAAQTVLNDDAYLQQSVINNTQQLADLTQFCRQKGLNYIPSMGNFITIDFQQPAQPIYEKLLRKGIIVRPLVGYGMQDYLRISIGLPHENQRVKQALCDILSL